jgi:hypothetical protein
VASIPEGYVTTYGDVARLAGSPRAARQVGGAMAIDHPMPGQSGPFRQTLQHTAHLARRARRTGAAGRRGAGLRRRPYRSPALSLGLLKTKKKPPFGTDTVQTVINQGGTHADLTLVPVQQTAVPVAQ